MRMRLAKYCENPQCKARIAIAGLCSKCIAVPKIHAAWSRLKERPAGTKASVSGG